MSLSPEAVQNAIRTEGPEVMGAAGEGYWRDMRRMYPHTDMQPDIHTPRERTRFGKVTLRQRGGRWERRVAGEWVPVDGTNAQRSTLNAQRSRKMG
jgi:hypothetical protein